MASYPTADGMTFPVSHADPTIKVDELGRHVSYDSFMFRVESGQIPGLSVGSASGINTNVGTSFEAVSDGGIFFLPPPQIGRAHV